MVAYPLTFPASIPLARSAMSLSFLSHVFESQFGQQEKIATVAEGKADRWEGEWTTPPLSVDQRDELTAWLVSLEGQLGTFNAFDPDRRAPPSNPGNGQVMRAGQTGNTLLVDQLPADTLVLPAGYYFQVGVGYHMAIVDALTNGPGEVTIEFEPAMRVSPADNATVVITNPVLIARVMVDPEWTTGVVINQPIRIPWKEKVA